MSANGNSHRFTDSYPKGPRAGAVNQARRLARLIGIPIEEVMSRRAAGLKWCRDHGWEDKEAARLCFNKRRAEYKRARRARES